MKVRLTPAAASELADAIRWYDMQALGLGDRFLDEFETLKRRLGENPKQFPVIYRAARRASFHSFPYGLFFRVAEDAVQIFACFHFSRDPVVWQRRI